jgi:hypothetical protein
MAPYRYFVDRLWHREDRRAVLSPRVDLGEPHASDFSKYQKQMKEFHYRFFTPTMIESENDIQKKHWTTRHRYRKVLELEIYCLTIEAKREFDDLMAAGKIPSDWKTKILYVTYRRKELDTDNLIAGTKPWTDSLVACGWARGDSPDIFEAKVRWVLVEKKSEEMTGIDITIY